MFNRNIKKDILQNKHKISKSVRNDNNIVPRTNEFDELNSKDYNFSPKDSNFNEFDEFNEFNDSKLYSNNSNDFNSYSSLTDSSIDKHSDLLKQLTNFDDYYRKLAIEWLGLIWDDKKKKYIPDPTVLPMVNMEFVKWAIPYMRTYIRDNNIIVHLNKDEYCNLMEDVVEDVFITIAVKKKDFGIISQTTMMTVSSQIVNGISLILLGAGDGKYIKLLTETTQRSETVNLANAKDYNQNKPSFTEKVKGMLFGGRR